MVDRLTIAPFPLLAISGASSATKKNGALTLSEYTLSNTSSLISCVGPNGYIPALLIRISIWPLPNSTALLATSRALAASRRLEEMNSALLLLSGFQQPPSGRAPHCGPRAQRGSQAGPVYGLSPDRYRWFLP